MDVTKYIVYINDVLIMNSSLLTNQIVSNPTTNFCSEQILSQIWTQAQYTKVRPYNHDSNIHKYI